MRMLFVFNGMKETVSDAAAVVRESIHAEAAPGIYNVVINCPGFSREALMYALNHMMEHKATSLVFMDMTPDDRDLWLKTFLAKYYHTWSEQIRYTCSIPSILDAT
jgi:alpha-D-ribose 1-methylphosphonate 5-triphosphate synthase subunit PhnH